MSEDAYHIAHQLLAEFGLAADQEIQHKIERYTTSSNYNALKTWYAVEEAFNEIRGLSEEKHTEKALAHHN